MMTATNEVTHVPFLEGQTIAPGMILHMVNHVARDTGEDRLPFLMSRFSLEPGARSPLDRHAERELWFVAAGVGTLSYCDGGILAIAAGEVIEIPPEIAHTVSNDGRHPLVVFSVWWSSHRQT